MRAPKLRALPLLAAALLCSGCGAATWAALAGLNPPAAEVDALRVVLQSPTAALLTAELRAPTGARTLEVRRVEWTLWLRGRRFASGVATTPESHQEGGVWVVRLEAPLVFLEPPEPGTAALMLKGTLVGARRDEERLFTFAQSVVGRIEQAR